MEVDRRRVLLAAAMLAGEARDPPAAAALASVNVSGVQPPGTETDREEPCHRADSHINSYKCNILLAE